MAKGKELAKRPAPGAIQTMEPWEEELAKEARDEQAKETLGVQRIQHKASIISIDKKPVAGNKLPHAIIDYIVTRSFFKEKWQEGKPSTPACYAYGRDPKLLIPHDASEAKQAVDCSHCPHAEYGTAENGRGQRCREERKVMVICPPPQGSAGSEEEAIQKAEVRQYTVPPGSLKNWGAYLNGIKEISPSGNVRTVLTELGTEPKGGAYALTFRAIDRLSPEAAKAVLARRESVQGALFAPWPKIAEEEVEETAPKKSRAKKIS